MNDGAPNHDNEGAWGEEEGEGGEGDDDDDDLGLSIGTSVGVTPRILSPSSPLLLHSVLLVALRYCKWK